MVAKKESQSHWESNNNNNGDDEEEYSIANEKISLELILSDWNKEQEQVSRVIEYNRQAGIRNPEAYIGYGFAPGTTEPADVKRRIRWWNSITNKRTGKPNTLEALRNGGVISDDEMDLFGDNPVFRKESYHKYIEFIRMMAANGYYAKKDSAA